jgi:hypothetical protein
LYNIVLSLKEVIIIKRYLFLSIYLICLITFTVYFFLDTLVISSVYEVIEGTTSDKEEISTGKVETTSNSYSDDNIDIYSVSDDGSTICTIKHMKEFYYDIKNI